MRLASQVVLQRERGAVNDIALLILRGCGWRRVCWM
jgi:hypothetical protein